MNHDVFLLNVITPRTNELSWLKTLLNHIIIRCVVTLLTLNTMSQLQYCFSACKFARFIGNWV